MNKKGFTLVELILVVVIIGIISAITIPSIMDALSESKTTGGETVEKLLETNLELYNTDNKEDLWCLEDSKCESDDPNKTCITVQLNDLYSMNPDIDFGDCVLKDNNSLVIRRDTDNNSYTYSANIVCSKGFKESIPNHILNGKDTSNQYYETQGFQNCP